MNRLAQESSPYLLAHKDNLVDWYPWGPEALALAAAQNKPIFLSIGYSACHWCTVMSEESFNDPAIAGVLNENFVNILVDREERPDVDQCYQAAANVLGHAGGWPLSTFLTPQKVAFLVGTYFPKEERAGQAPPFRSIIDNVLRTVRDEAAQVATVAENVVTQLGNLWQRDMRGPIGPDMLDSAAVRIAQRFDIFFGGLTQQQPKFPSVTYQLHGVQPSKGLAVARMAAHITYLSEAALQRKFGRELQDREQISFGFGPDFQIESYLRHQGIAFVDRFDANSYLYITRAMDYFDLAAEHGGVLAQAFAGAKARFLIVSFTSDWLFPTAQNKHVAHALNASAATVSFVEIATDRGHDAFLLDEPEMFATIRGFLNSVAASVGA
ncbi:MAG: DUF255 domain-containing protein [Rhizomicrobium sp.]